MYKLYIFFFKTALSEDLEIEFSTYVKVIEVSKFFSTTKYNKVNLPSEFQ